MKKGLLCIAFGMLCLISKAQVVCNIQSPASLAGNYSMTYADPASGWGSPDLMDPLNSLTDTLAIVDDGTTADSLGCNNLINGTELAGKIAVVFRGSCQFGTKALKAEQAGAIACIIINNVPGDPVGMAAGDDGASITIPVIMISQIDGANIVSAINGGQDVVAFIGNKFGLYDTDLGITPDRVLLPNPNSMPQILAQDATEHNFRVGAWVFNYGNLQQTNATFSATVTMNGTTLYDETMTVDPINLGDTLFLELPQFSQATYPVGKYTINYSLTTTQTDEYDSDNSFSTDFFIDDEIFSFTQLDDSLGLPMSTTGFRTSTATSKFSSCIHFRNTNASRVKIPGIYFSALTNTSTNLLGQEIIVSAYQWDNDFTDLNDANAAIDLFQEVGTGSYIYEDSMMEGTTVYAPLSSPVVLLDDQRYFFCATTFDANTFIGFGNLVYNLNLDTYLQPLFPLETDTGFDMVGFGGEAPAIGLKMVPVNAGLNDMENLAISVYPNPSNNVINVKGSDLNKFDNVNLKDQLGRTIGSWNINGTNASLDISKYETGNYFVVLNGTNGSVVYKVQIID